MDSHSAAHPSALALENLLRQLPDGGVEVLPEPKPENRLDAYSTGAIYLREALMMASEMIPQLQIDGIEEVAGGFARDGTPRASAPQKADRRRRLTLRRRD
jgi:hypothetical protein